MKVRLLPVLLALSALASGETLVLRNFTLIDGTGRAPVANAGLVITDGRITYAGPAAGLKAPAGAATTDLGGKFIMPGIINLHCHLGNVVGLVQDPKFFTKENVNSQLDTYAKYGVTSVLSMGSDQPVIWNMRAEQRAGRPRRARIFTALRGFAGKGGYPTTVPGMKGVPYEVASPAEVEADMNDLAPKHPDVVKVWVDDHLGKEKKIPTPITAAIIKAAKKHGLNTCAHIFYYDDAKALAENGLYACVHSVRDRDVDAALISAMKKNGTWQVGTLAREMSTFAFAKPPAFLSDPFFTMGTTPAVISTLRSDAFLQKQNADHDLPKYPGFLATAQRNLKKLYDSGVKVAFGTDSGPPARFSGFSEHLEMDLMAQAGFTPMQIITSFSKNSAEFLGSRDLGTLESGHWADLVVLARNPLDNIKNSRSIEAVYIAGNKVR